MPVTAVYALPYPSLSDTADVPRDIQALAVKLDALSLVPTVVTALPGSPVDGQEIYYQSAAMATAGVAWHLRYRAGATGSYKWEFLGGAPISAEYLPLETFNSANPSVWFGINANDPKLNVPLAGDYDAQHSVAMTVSSAGIVSTGLRVAGTEPVSGTNNMNVTVAAGGWGAATQRRRITALAANAELAQRYLHSAAGAANFSRLSAHMAVWPVRVG
jgi:hypothetical protein